MNTNNEGVKALLLADALNMLVPPGCPDRYYVTSFSEGPNITKSSARPNGMYVENIPIALGLDQLRLLLVQAKEAIAKGEVVVTLMCE